MDVNRVEAELIGDQLDQIGGRQQQFQRYLARHLAVDPAGLTVMEHLIRHGSATPTELARRLEVSTAAMTLVLDRLEAAGHTSRGPHPSDRRKVLVTAAEASAQTAQELVEPLLQRVDGLAASLTEAERLTVSRFLAGVISEYDDVLALRAGVAGTPARPPR